MDAKTVQAWIGIANAAQPLIAAGLVAAGQIVAMFKHAHPEATDAELNAALGAVIATAEAERQAIADELARTNPDGYK
jgi:hypothetical protein